MKRSSLFCATLALFVNVGLVRADPTSWSVTWTPSTGTIAPDKGSTSKISLTGNSDSGSSNLNQTVYTTAVFVQYSSTAAANMADTFTKKTFDLTATLTDTASGKSQDLTFKLQFDGNLSRSGTTLKLTTLPSDPLFTDPLGGHIYRVRVSYYIAPSYPPTIQNPIGRAGVIVGTVTVVDPKGMPEPSTLVLSGLAAPLVAVYWRRRKKRTGPDGA
jgi:hypothetical protein